MIDDDAQVVFAVAVKRWCHLEEAPGAILLVDLEPSMPVPGA